MKEQVFNCYVMNDNADLPASLSNKGVRLQLMFKYSGGKLLNKIIDKEYCRIIRNGLALLVWALEAWTS